MAQRAIRASEAALGGAPVQPLGPAQPGCKAVASPALALQASLAATYGSAEFQDSPEPYVARWAPLTRVAVLVGAAASSWGLVLGGVALLRR